MSDVWSEAQSLAAAQAAARRLDATGFVAHPTTRPGFTPWTTGEPQAPVERAPVHEPEALQAEAYAAGLAEGQRMLEAALAAERAAVGRLCDGLAGLQPEPPQQLGQVLAVTVQRLVAQIVGTTPVDEAVLRERCLAAAALVTDEASPARLHVAPEDITRLAGTPLPVELVPDPSLRQGALRLETGAGWVEDGPELRLARLRQALDRIGA